jgi:hypothetical protein
VRPDQIKRAHDLLRQVEEIDRALRGVSNRHEWKMSFYRSGDPLDVESTSITITCASITEQHRFLESMKETRVASLKELGVSDVR